MNFLISSSKKSRAFSFLSFELDLSKPLRALFSIYSVKETGFLASMSGSSPSSSVGTSYFLYGRDGREMLGHWILPCNQLLTKLTRPHMLKMAYVTSESALTPTCIFFGKKVHRAKSWLKSPTSEPWLLMNSLT